MHIEVHPGAEKTQHEYKRERKTRRMPSTNIKGNLVSFFARERPARMEKLEACAGTNQTLHRFLIILFDFVTRDVDS